MAWFYNGKQIYGAWTDGYGVEHPADWETAWSDAEKKKVGLISRGTLNDRFFDEDGEKHSVDYIQAHEEVRMQGLLAMILGQTMSDTISDSDGETLVQIPPEIVAKREQALSIDSLPGVPAHSEEWCHLGVQAVIRRVSSGRRQGSVNPLKG